MHHVSREGDPPRDFLAALRWLRERSPTPLLVTEGPSHVVRYLNAAFFELLGPDGAGSLEGRPFAEVFPELPDEVGRAVLDRVYATQEPQQTAEFEWRHPRRDDRVRSLSLSLSIWPALDEGEGPRHLVVEVRDVTDGARELDRRHELAEEARRINERLVVAGVRMQELADEAESARERLAILAEAGALLSSTFELATMVPAVARLLATRLVDVCAVDVLEGPGVGTMTVIEPSSFASESATERAIACMRARALAGTGSLDRVVLAPDDDGELRALGFAFGMAISLRSPTRKLASITVLARRDAVDPVDVTTVVEIAGRVAIAIERVEHYEKAVSAARAREELLATVSHDLRSPLHTILFSLALAEKSATGLSSGEARHLGRIRRTAEYMQHLLADLVDSEKIEAHRFLVDRTPCPVAPLLTDVVEMILPLAANKSIEIETAIDEAAASSIVWLDRDRMTQVLTNLLGNAVKFTPERGSIVVRAERRDDEVCVSVRDTGPGIPREDLGRVFDRFWQARQTAQLGSGLGLFIARGIVLAHGGRIWAESDPGAGSTLHVALPAAPARPAITASSSSSSSPCGAGSASR